LKLGLVTIAVVCLAVHPALQAREQGVTLTVHVKVIQHGKHAPSSHGANVVVWLSPLDPQIPRRRFMGAQLRLVQHNKSFQPHLLVVPVGAVVQFPNHDPFFHNVFSLFDGKRFDLGLYEAGSSRNVSFDRPGVSYIFCNIHAEMSAVVIALATPYYGISNSAGELVVPEVPLGHYAMHVWYEAAPQATLDAMTRVIDVTGATSTLGVLEVPASPNVIAHKNKYGMDYEPAAPDSPGYDQR
jgi:hypothetical protein